MIQANSKSRSCTPAKGVKFVDKTERVSRFKQIRTQPLFDLIDDYISKMNERDELFEFMLFKNDVTLIEYEEGGFFEVISVRISGKNRNTRTI